jgi:hypothetical protein
MVVRSVVGNMAIEATDGGRPVETTTHDVLDAFEARADPAEPLTATDVADRVECSRRTALNRLDDLADVGEGTSKKVGGRARVWWVPLDESDKTGAASAESTPDHEADRSPSVADDGHKNALDEDLRGYLAATDQPPKTAHGRNAVLDVFRTLRERGEPMKTGDLQDEVYPGYEDDWSTARAMWNAIDRYLPDIPGIEKAGYGEWTYTGDKSVREVLADE